MRVKHAEVDASAAFIAAQTLPYGKRAMSFLGWDNVQACCTACSSRATVWAVQLDVQGSRFLEKREKPEQRGEMRIVDLACDDFA